MKEKLIDVVEELAADRAAEVLDFALFIQSRYSEPRADSTEPVQTLEDLWGDFWPDDEPVDDFLNAVRRWRCEGSDPDHESLLK